MMIWVLLLVSMVSSGQSLSVNPTRLDPRLEPSVKSQTDVIANFTPPHDIEPSPSDHVVTRSRAHVFAEITPKYFVPKSAEVNRLSTRERELSIFPLAESFHEFISASDAIHDTGRPSALHRTSRSLARCSPTEEQMNELLAEFKNPNQLVTDKYRNETEHDTCETRIQSLGPFFLDGGCMQYYNILRCVIEIKLEFQRLVSGGEIKLEFQRLVSGGMPSGFHDDDVMASYVRKMQALWSRVVELGNSASKEDKIKLDQLANGLEACQGKMQNSLIKLTDEHLLLCTADIANNAIDSAIKKYTILQDLHKRITGVGFSELLAKTVQTAYSNNVENTENIVNFLRGLSHSGHDVFGCSALYDVMKSNNHLKTPLILMLANLVRELMNLPRYKDASSNEPRELLIDTSRAIASPIHRLLCRWSLNIRKGNYEVVNAYSADVASYLEVLVSLAYAHNVENTDNILMFVKGLKYTSQKATALKSLLDEMREHNHINGPQILMWAYQVKNTMDSADCDQAGEEDNSNLVSIMNQLPDTVRHIFWNQVCIKNVDHSEYLFATRGRQASAKTRWACTYTGREKQLSQGFWRFESSNEGKSFRIRNAKFNDYLYANNIEHYSDRNNGYVYTWQLGEGNEKFEWEIELISNASRIRLKNVVGNDYLYLSEDVKFLDRNENLRRVTTWINGEVIPYADWEIEQC